MPPTSVAATDYRVDPAPESKDKPIHTDVPRAVDPAKIGRLNHPQCLPSALLLATEFRIAAGSPREDASLLALIRAGSGSLGIDLRLRIYKDNREQDGLFAEPGHAGLALAYASAPWASVSVRELLVRYSFKDLGRREVLAGDGREFVLLSALHQNDDLAALALDAMLRAPTASPDLVAHFVGRPVAAAMQAQRDLRGLGGLTAETEGALNIPVDFVPLARTILGLEVHGLPSRTAVGVLASKQSLAAERNAKLAILLEETPLSVFGLAAAWEHLFPAEKVLAIDVLARRPQSFAVSAILARAAVDENALVANSTLAALFQKPRHVDDSVIAALIAVANGPISATKSLAFSILTNRLGDNASRIPALITLACSGPHHLQEEKKIGRALGGLADRLPYLAASFGLLLPPNQPPRITQTDSGTVRTDAGHDVSANRLRSAA